MQNVNQFPNNPAITHKKVTKSDHVRRRFDRSAFAVSLAALVIIIPLVLFSMALIFFQVRQLNLPNVYIFDRHVGLINQSDTAVLIDEIWNQNRAIDLMASEDIGIHFQLAPQELGLWVDPQASAKSAYAIGRSSEPFKDLISSLSGQSQVIMPVLYFNEQQARLTLQSIADDLAIAPKDASIVFQDGVWGALPGMDGQSVDIDASINNLAENAFKILLTGSSVLHLQTVPPTVIDLSPLIDQIETLIAQEMRLIAYDPITDQTFEWTVPLELKTSWVVLDPEANQIDLSINQDDLEDLLLAWTNDLGEGRSFDPEFDLNLLIESWHKGETSFVTIYHQPTTYLVSQGESLWSISLKLGIPMWYIMEVNPSLTINTLAAGMNLNIPSKNVLLPLPVVPNKRILIDISEQRMTVYEHGQIRNTHIISTGVADSPTMAGIFQVQTHEINAYASNWDLYMPHFLGIYEAWPGFMNGIHGLPLLSSGNRLWASNLGTPASYGCIILDLAAAEDLYYWADPGVVVEIRQ